MNGRVAGLHISPGGLPKHAKPSIEVKREGVVGDDHRDRKNHGGPDQAVCLLSVELYNELIREGITVKPGDFGENLTTASIDLAELRPGNRLHVGDTCVLEISKVRAPCHKLGQFDARLPKALLGRSGWMARVRLEGTVRIGDHVRVDGDTASGDD